MDGEVVIEGPLTGIIQLLGQNADILTKLSLNHVSWVNTSNAKHRQQNNISRHYDLGNDFYKLWLDPSMTYTCGYFKKPTDGIRTAQQQKLRYVLSKLQLQKGQRLLDIGSGWGGLLIAAAKTYGVEGYGVTLSKEQYNYAIAAAKTQGISHLVRFELCNYLDLLKRDSMGFDRVVSVGMFEAVGRRDLDKYFQVIDRHMKQGGLSLLHTITQERETKNDPWIDKYIFPGGYAPAYREILRLFPRHNFRFIDYENLRMHYVHTLSQWLRRYERHKVRIESMYDERFYRMWHLYLACSCASFEYWDLSLSQFVFTKGLVNDLPLTREYLYS